MEKSLNEMLLKNASKENKKIKIEQEQPYTSFVLGDNAVKSYSILCKYGNGYALEV